MQDRQWIAINQKLMSYDFCPTNDEYCDAYDLNYDHHRWSLVKDVMCYRESEDLVIATVGESANDAVAHD